MPIAFEWMTYAWWIEGCIATLLLVVVVGLSSLDEDAFSGGNRRVGGYLALAAGIWSLFAVPLEFGIQHGLVMVTVAVVWVCAGAFAAAGKRRQLKQQSQSHWPWRRISRRGIYYLDKEMADNAVSDRFGTTIIGRRAHRNLWQRLTRQDGWTRSQRAALVRHELGHSIFGIPFLCADVYVAHFLFVNVQNWPVGTLTAPVAAFALMTLLAWADELLADAIAGPSGFSLLRVFVNEPFSLDNMLGSVGYASHPPLIFRLVAYGWPFVVPIVAAVVLLRPR